MPAPLLPLVKTRLAWFGLVVGFAGVRVNIAGVVVDELVTVAENVLADIVRYSHQRLIETIQVEHRVVLRIYVRVATDIDVSIRGHTVVCAELRDAVARSSIRK